MGRVVNTWAASVGLDGAIFTQWRAAVRCVFRRPALDQLVALPARVAPTATDLWRQAVIAGREAKARGDTRGQHQAAEDAKRYVRAQLEAFR